MKIALAVACLICSLTAWGQEQEKSALDDRIRSVLGDADDQFGLGLRFAAGRGVPQDDEEAVKWYRFAAEQGHAAAQHILGMMYDEGRGVPQDHEEAVKWYRLAAEQGLDDAQDSLGLAYAQGRGVPQDHEEAVKWYRLAAEQGLALTQARLGAMYSLGQNVPQHHVEAVKWYRLAAEQGLAAAQSGLSEQYYHGQGVPQDYEEAVKWDRFAAEQGHAAGQFSLGMAYYFGQGVPQDYIQAHMWSNLAASRASGANAKSLSEARDDLADLMSSQQIAEAQRLAREWKPKTWDDLQRTSAGERLRSVQPTEESRLAPRQTTLAEINGVEMWFVSIPPGEFEMGCSPGDGACQEDEKPRHRVRITKEFEMCKYEVTQAQWEAVMGSNPSEFEGTGRPVESVSWNDVQEFLGKLNERGDKYYYRLPTEAEWEYAARAGNKGSGTQDPDAVGWYRDNSANRTHEVGQKEPNSFGLYDMQGNVWEWVEDWYWYGENFYRYRDHLQTDPKGPSSGNRKVVRGGSWYSSARHMSFSDRGWFDLPTRFDVCGFRCVRERRR